MRRPHLFSFQAINALAEVELSQRFSNRENFQVRNRIAPLVQTEPLQQQKQCEALVVTCASSSTDDRHEQTFRARSVSDVLVPLLMWYGAFARTGIPR
jgi:hypothetical protein